MMYGKNILPAGPSPEALRPRHFPAAFQAVVWRNWGMVPVERLAHILGTSTENILKTADDLGLRVPPVLNKRWLARGYITIIKNNWHLLTYEQLLELLDWSPEQLAYALKEDDFLYHKVGLLKPKPESVQFRPLEPEEITATAEIRKTINRYFPGPEEDAAEDVAGDMAGGTDGDAVVGASGAKSGAEAFDFIDELSAPVKYALYTFGKPMEDEIVIDGRWSIVYGGRSKLVKAAAGRFVRHIEEKFGFNINISTGNPSGNISGDSLYDLAGNYSCNSSGNPDGVKEIQLVVKPDRDYMAESHIIHISPDHIVIKAVDNEGVMRGLLRLENELTIRGAPYLKEQLITRRTKIDLRIIYSYFAVYGDPFIDPELDPFPEGLLERLAAAGINGIWLQAVLYRLVPFKYDISLSEGWEQRIAGLRRMVKKAASYGIGIYLYLNEPRAMRPEVFDKYPDIAGHRIDNTGYICMCTSKKEVQDYLRESCAKLFKEVSGLAGVFTITMSENRTNCYSGSKTNCPVCSQRKAHEVIAEVNRCIEEGVHSVKPGAKVICWNWGWNE